MNEFCSREILRYSDMINRHEVSNYSVSELIEFLQHSDGDANFSEFAANGTSAINSSLNQPQCSLGSR